MDKTALQKLAIVAALTLLNISVGLCAVCIIYGREVGQEQAKTNPFDLHKYLPWKWSKSNIDDLYGAMLGFLLALLAVQFWGL